MNRLTILRCFCVLALALSAFAEAAVLTRGPYLQMQTDAGITLRWRTDTATDSVVRYGLSPANLNLTANVTGTRTEHSVAIAGLSSGQQYWYSVGSTTQVLAGDSTYHFHAAPPRSQAADTRIWVLGDSGTANANARAVRDAYLGWAASNPADIWLMLGDNAYNNGTDAEYQAAVFNIYPEMLRQKPLWSTLGNHDGYSADSLTQSGPYYDIFDLPDNGQIGGLPSGTEAYYSFDYANIHFVCLDSYDSDRGSNGPMLQWLEADLALNTQPWVIAFFHHPPYTKGSHNSDSEVELIDMRQNALPLLEARGVDLVLTGHSHTYERSYLIDGHHGVSGTWNPAIHALDSGDGRPGGSGSYLKPDVVAAPNFGAVFAVAGSSGKVSTGYPLNHPAMFIALESLGSMVLDVSGDRLDAVFLDQAGAVRDSFTIQKSPDSQPPLLSTASAQDATHVLVGFSEPLDPVTATEPGNYLIAGLTVSAAELQADNQSVRLGTSAMTDATIYTVVVNGVEDLQGNVIAPDSSIDFNYVDTMELAFQDGITPDPAYAGTRDAYIREASATTNYGSATSLQVDGDEPSTSTQDMNILLRWDISAIPPGVTLLAAEMLLEVSNTSSGNYRCYALERAWSETGVTWNDAAAGQAWGSPGAESAGDRSATPLCSITAPALGNITVPFAAAGLQRIQAWIDNPATNHGLIIADSAITDGADFHSSESGVVLARPRLNLLYHTPPPAPGSLLVFSDSFESGQWNGLWSQDAQNDWFTSTQRSVAGTNSAEVDGSATNAQLVSVPVDLQGRSAASIRFNWFIETALDKNEYLAFDVSTDGGVSWVEKARLWGNVDTENLWHQTQVELTGIAALKLRFRGSMSGSDEDANVDTVSVVAHGAGGPTNLPPQADFASACNFLQCSFTGQATDLDGSVVAHHWDFGDGNSSTAANPQHTYAAAGSYTVTYSATDNQGAMGQDSQAVLVTPPPTSAIVFSDSFENGQWNGKWTQDSQNDWFTSTQRSFSGSNSAEIDGSATDAWLRSVPINLQGFSKASISFNWFIEAGVDSGEYLAFDVSTNGGQSWSELGRLRGDVDTEDSWRPAQFELSGISSLQIRFRGRVSGSTEDANLDEVRVIAH